MFIEKHQKEEPCLNRPPYRDGAKKTVVKSYSISQESLYLIIFGVPSINIKKNLKNKCKDFGEIERFFQIFDHEGIEKFTEAYCVQYSKMSEARYAKRKLDDLSFFGNCLHVSFAPELESVSECRLKLHYRRCQMKAVTRQTNNNDNDTTAPIDEPISVHTHPSPPHSSSSFLHPPFSQFIPFPKSSAPEAIQQAYCLKSKFPSVVSDYSVVKPTNQSATIVPSRVVRTLKRQLQNSAKDTSETEENTVIKINRVTLK